MFKMRAKYLKLNLGFNKSINQELMRKSIHLSSLWIPLLIYFSNMIFAFSVFFVLFIADITFEYGNYKKWSWVRATYGKLFFKMLRRKEKQKKKFQICGSLYVLIASMLAVVLFSKEIAVVSLSVMLISDTFAAIFGKIYGSREIRKNKTMEGTIAFFISSLIVMLLCNSLFAVNYASIIACFAATVAEVYEDKIKVDDNLSIPLVIGFIFTFIK